MFRNVLMAKPESVIIQKERAMRRGKKGLQMKIHFIQQDDWVEPGEYLSWAERNGYEHSITRCWLHEELPQEVSADMLIVLGGYQNPEMTKEECDYFDSEEQQRLIRAYVSAGKIVIGSCLGAQLIGQALGARYEHSPEPEIGPVRARLTAAGRSDQFLAAFPDQFDAGEWHNDMPGLTEDAVVLAESDGCPRQITKYGKYVYALQTHMEFTHDIVAAGLADIGGQLKEKGKYVQTTEELLDYDYTEMNHLLSTFLDRLTEEYLTEK